MKANVRTSVFIGIAIVAATAGLAARADTVTKPEQVYGLGSVRSVAFSPDGKSILIGAAANAYLFDPVTGTRRRRTLC